MPSAVFTVRLPDEVKDQLEALAKATNRSKGFIVNRAIEDYVTRNAWRAKELQEAIEEAEKGEFISNEAIEAWLDTWGSERDLPPPKLDIKVGSKTRRG